MLCCLVRRSFVKCIQITKVYIKVIKKNKQSLALLGSDMVKLCKPKLDNVLRCFVGMCKSIYRYLIIVHLVLFNWQCSLNEVFGEEK